MLSSTLQEFYESQLNQLTSTNQLRHCTAYEPIDSTHVRLQGKTYLMMASNNYLGLTHHPEVLAHAKKALTNYGTGSGGARLTSGTYPALSQLEAQLANFKGTEQALIFNTGYMANVGTISGLMSKGDHILSDALNHASIIDGCRLSGAHIHIYNHNDCNHLESLLKSLPPTGKRLIVTDGVFSMDGDIAPLPDLVTLAKRYETLLMVDDAHATGVIGSGRGTAHHFNCSQEVDIQLGTLSKALGSEGGFVCANELIINTLINRSRSFIFSTALVPAAIGAAQQSLTLLSQDASIYQRLQHNIEYMTQALLQKRITVAHKTTATSLAAQYQPTPIFPIIVGSAETALKLSQELFERGIILTAIRPPTVPQGESRLRLTVTAAHKESDLQYVADTLSELI
ncbi:8-amino-7-oxononanoate synthase [Veillonella intestinalis]|uniref:8-amino-7-oxononanoate synthase n=1 Tax=Veillonella intestinalis TaxID=2941341 RepID=UPI00203F0D5B|nr:8-amino-7-oxononanoate synthase [Veillonella intestinalis]